MEISDILSVYYRDSRVRYRLEEFLGQTCTGEFTSAFITADNASIAQRVPKSANELIPCLDQGMEICRSLWDSSALIAHLDIEYVNFDSPGEAYRRPERVFGLQSPVEDTVESLLRGSGIKPLHILSGRGHHYVWQIPLTSDAFSRLVEIGEDASATLQSSQRPAGFEGRSVSATLREAFDGLSLVMESLAHEIKERSAPLCDIPVELTAVEVGPSQGGREMVSIDISEYGDPLQTRTVRVPFSVYLKPWQQRAAIGPDLVDSLPPIFFIPLEDMQGSEGLRIMRDAELTMELAGSSSTRIPEQSAGMDRLITRYLASDLHLFHDWFYSHRHNDPGKWPETYDQTPLEALPCCARRVLEKPNDLLLRPSGMRLVTRALLALGWHPRHIAGLIRSKFARDHHWGDQWKDYDPAMRADFYTRVFAGLFAVGRDDLVDFNCQSSKEEKTCWNPECPENLDWFRQSALSRRRYGCLAHRPFNRLFPSEKHL